MAQSTKEDMKLVTVHVIMLNDQVVSAVVSDERVAAQVMDEEEAKYLERHYKGESEREIPFLYWHIESVSGLAP